MEEMQSKGRSAVVSLTTSDGGLLSKPARLSYRYGAIERSTVTDASGQSIIPLPVFSDVTDPTLYIKLKQGRDSSFLSMEVPAKEHKARVTFYPEGGHMVEGLPCLVGWEVKDEQGRPIAVKALLYKDQEVIDTIETTGYGIGKFMLTPQKGARYSVKLVHSGLIDTTYTLPLAEDRGLIMHLQEAIASDTLKIRVTSTKAQSITLLVHNPKEPFINFPFQVQAQSTRVLNVALKGLHLQKESFLPTMTLCTRSAC
jgi:hypothetical protein